MNPAAFPNSTHAGREPSEPDHAAPGAVSGATPTDTAPSRTVAAALRLLGALGPLLDLPRVEREATINAGQLRLLVLLAGQGGPSVGVASIGADRYGARVLDGHEQSTVDARLAYLQGKGLIRPADKGAYHDAARHLPTPTGRRMVRQLLGSRARSDLVDALDRVCALPVVRREAPGNVSHLDVLARVVAEPGVTLPGIVGDGRRGTKPAVRSRLRWLEDRMLVERLPRFNAGGSSNPNRFQALSAGVDLVDALTSGP